LKFVIWTLLFPIDILAEELFFLEASGNFWGKFKFDKAWRKVSLRSSFSIAYLSRVSLVKVGSRIGVWLSETSKGKFIRKRLDFLNIWKKIYTEEILPGLRQRYGITSVLKMFFLEIMDDSVLLGELNYQIRMSRHFPWWFP